MRQFMYLSLLLLSALVLGACQLIQAPSVIEGNDFAGVIFPAQTTGPLYVGETGFWTPTPTDVQALEAGLENFLNAANDPRVDADLLTRLPTYTRQYVGIVEDGQQKIYALYYCNFPITDLQKGVQFVSDGGNCFFQLKYSVQDQSFSELMINGEA